MDPISLSALSALFSGGIGALANSFSNPSRKAQPYMNEVTNMARERYNPEHQKLLGDQYAQQASDPAAFLNQLMSSYKPTAGHQFKKDQALKAMRSAASAGGYAGSDQDLLDTMESSGMMEEQGMQNWLQNALGIHNTGLSGLQNQSNMAFGDLSNALGQQATLGYQGAANQMQNRGNLFNSLMNAGGQGYGMQQGLNQQQQFHDWLKNFMGSQNQNPSVQQGSDISSFNPLDGNYGLYSGRSR